MADGGVTSTSTSKGSGDNAGCMRFVLSGYRRGSVSLNCLLGGTNASDFAMGTRFIGDSRGSMGGTTVLTGLAFSMRMFTARGASMWTSTWTPCTRSFNLGLCKETWVPGVVRGRVCPGVNGGGVVTSDVLSLTVYTDMVANTAFSLTADGSRIGVTIRTNGIGMATALKGLGAFSTRTGTSGDNCSRMTRARNTARAFNAFIGNNATRVGSNALALSEVVRNSGTAFSVIFSGRSGVSVRCRAIVRAVRSAKLFSKLMVRVSKRDFGNIATISR